MNNKHFILPLMSMLFLASCGDDETINGGNSQTGGIQTSDDIAGMYILNEGNWGANKASVDYLDFTSTPQTYTSNLYAIRNPKEVLGLGDMGSDIKIYGSQMWMVINGSNKVEIVDVATCVKKGQVDVPNGRYLAFDGGYAYVCSYAGTSMSNGNASPGCVYKIDTLSLETVGRVDVGYQPEELAVVDGKLYVANSGGYCAPDYDRTVSVIDLATFRETEKIDLAINLHRLKADKYGKLWVTSRGDYGANAPKLLVMDKDSNGKMAVKATFTQTPSDFCIVGDSLYYYSAEWSYAAGGYEFAYGIINVNTCDIVATTLFKTPADEANIMMPYGIIVSPYTSKEYPASRDFYIMDAMDYTSSGKVHHFNADGSFDYSYTAGDLPGHAAFVMK